MSMLRALQEWLEQFDKMEMRPIREILTDLTDKTPSSYALAPSGNSTIKKDVMGNVTYQNSYVFYAVEHGVDEIDRQDNYDFIESFQNWIEERDEAGDYPPMPSNFSVERISVSNAMLFDVSDNGTCLYQIQIQVIMTKKRRIE